MARFDEDGSGRARSAIQHARTTVTLDDDRVRTAQRLMTIREKSALIRETSTPPARRKAAKALAALGGTMPDLQRIPRRRNAPNKFSRILNMSPDEYLRTFFVELGRLAPGNRHGVSHAIAYEDGKIYALVSMGDARAVVPVKKVDPDPVKMAAKVVELWRACIDRKKLVLE